MALTLLSDSPDAISLSEYLDYVRRNVDPRDQESIIESAPKLHALSRNKTLVVDRLNELVKNSFIGETIPSAQVIFLGDGVDFYVRANIWPSTADIASGRIFQDQFSYYQTHDHNYDFLTAGYSGPGYVTEIYEYNSEKLEGYVGEPVEMTFLERVHFQTGMVMFYRAGKDIHTQFPPDELSISLNLMLSTPDVVLKDQYFFDAEKGIVSEIPRDLDSSRRVSIVELAGYAGDDETKDLLYSMARSHPCRRTRIAAFESLERLSGPSSTVELWELACCDREPLVVNAARRRLRELGLLAR